MTLALSMGIRSQALGFREPFPPARSWPTLSLLGLVEMERASHGRIIMVRRPRLTPAGVRSAIKHNRDPNEALRRKSAPWRCGCQDPTGAGKTEETENALLRRDRPLALSRRSHARDRGSTSVRMCAVFPAHRSLSKSRFPHSASRRSAPKFTHAHPSGSGERACCT